MKPLPDTQCNRCNLYKSRKYILLIVLMQNTTHFVASEPHCFCQIYLDLNFQQCGCAKGSCEREVFGCTAVLTSETRWK